MKAQYTVTSAALSLGVSRQTASRAVSLLSLGVRLGDAKNAAVSLSAGDLSAIRHHLKKNLEKKSLCKFKQNNELWRRRKNLIEKNTPKA